MGGGARLIHSRTVSEQRTGKEVFLGVVVRIANEHFKVRRSSLTFFRYLEDGRESCTT